ncbi:hypothetical protein GCM10017056_34740 [Seohaeicola zhoushanensis]|uniref:Uncharacterized protein n=1 Tax=Seohaeicola zhoushanensis TaxID=1569283 RepID=A0A8J3GZ99_9RHOB|nr:hypothetical protein GCM10017056_34740 [Seohaeicola zhoushanensis]
MVPAIATIAAVVAAFEFGFIRSSDRIQALSRVDAVKVPRHRDRDKTGQP